MWGFYRTTGFAPATVETIPPPPPPQIHDERLAGPTLEQPETINVTEGDDALIPTGEIFEGTEEAMLKRLTALHDKTGDSHTAREIASDFTLEQYAAECAACKVEIQP